jgi:hypothetical protein
MSSSGAPWPFVDESDAISPTWLNGPVGKAIRFSMSVQYDTLASAAEAAIYAGLPGIAPADALPWACADRQIDPGPNESQQHLEGRLGQWLTRSQFYGTPTGVLLALLGYTDPNYPVIRTVSSSSAAASTVSTSIWNTYSSGTDPFSTGLFLPTPPVRTLVSPANWNWDGNGDPWIGVPGWWRAWVIIQSLGGVPWSSYTATFAGGIHFGDGTAIGWAGSQNDRQSLQNLTHKWRAAHNTVPSIIVSYASTLFGLSSSYGSSTLPDGHYGHWSKISTLTAHVGYTYSTGSAGGYPSVYLPATSTVTTTSTYSAYVAARTIGPASYIDGVP